MRQTDSVYKTRDAKNICSNNIIRRAALRRLYALKDDPEQLSSARARVTVLKFAGRTVQWMLIALVYYFLLSGSSIETRTVKCLQQALAVFIDLALGASAQVDAAT